MRHSSMMLGFVVLLAGCDAAVADRSADGGGSPDADASDAAPDRPTLRLFNVYTGTVDPRWPSLPPSLSTVELPPEMAFVAEVSDEVGSVRFTIDGTEIFDSEAPFRSSDADGSAWPVTVGTHAVSAQSFASTDGSGAALGESIMNFEITDVGTDASPDSGEHSAYKLWRTGSGRYVTRDQAGNFIDGDGSIVIAAEYVSLEEQGAGQLHYVTDEGAGDTIAFAFIVLLPDGFDPAVHYPLVVFLHHGSEAYRGTDNDGTPLDTPMFQGPTSLTRSENRVRFPAVILVPQHIRTFTEDGVSNEWAAFTSISNETGSVTSAAEPSQSSAFAYEVIDALAAGALDVGGKTVHIEPARIYVTGHSMGGLGTWDWMERRPDFFAAGIPMAGYPDHARAAAVVDTPIWSFHHEIDCYNPFVGSETMYELVTSPPNDGIKMHLTRLTFDTGGACDQAHFQTPGNAWQEDGLFEWLFSQVSDR